MRVGESNVMKRGDVGAPFGPATARGEAAGPFGERPAEALEAEMADEGGALDGDRLVLSPHVTPTRKTEVQGVGVDYAKMAERFVEEEEAPEGDALLLSPDLGKRVGEREAKGHRYMGKGWGGGGTSTANHGRRLPRP